MKKITAINKNCVSFSLQKNLFKLLLTFFAAFIVSNADAQPYSVVNTNDAGAGSLRAAILAANLHAGPDVITINTTGTITLLSHMPDITDPVTIDGGLSGPSLVINGKNGINNYNVLVIQSGGSGSIIKGLVFQNSYWGIWLNNASNCKIQGCYIGTNSTGTAAASNAYSGIEINGGSNNTIGGTNAGEGNVISGNQDCGIKIINGGTGNVILGNYIGTDAAGAVAIPNSNHGVAILASSGNTIGGTSAASKNVISGNDQYGISIENALNPNSILGNYIGTNAAGSAAVANKKFGILVDGSPGTVIGGTAAGSGNIVSGNTFSGISLVNGSTGIAIQGNYIGVGADGSTAIENKDQGIYIVGCNNNTIGGNVVGARNIISGNTTYGIHIENASGIVISGNYVGLNSGGTTKVSNKWIGVYLNGVTSSTIGGNTEADRNVVSGNDDYQVQLYNGSSNNLIKNNYIGLNAAGTAGIQNGINPSDGHNHGLFFSSGSNSNKVYNNVISGNGNYTAGYGCGIAVETSSDNNDIQYNIIGLLPDGQSDVGLTIGGNPRGTAANGIYVGPGETAPGVAGIPPAGTLILHNTIARSNGHGIVVNGGTSVLIKSNAIGTDSTGTVKVGNNQSGILLQNQSSGTVGGTASGDGNLLVNNNENGLYIQQTSGIVAQGNYIGVNKAGANMGNVLDGVYIEDFGSGAAGNIIGANVTVPAAGEKNIIAYNGKYGVEIKGANNNVANGNSIRGNSIFCNTTGGINLSGGANSSIAAPLITSISTTSISGTALANSVIHVYRNDTACNSCQGAIYLGTTTANASGNWTYNYGSTFSTARASSVTATQTNAAGSTSPFSSCCTKPVISNQPAATAVCSGTDATFSVTANGGAGITLVYQWQVSTDGGTSYSNISDGVDYSGVTTATLTVKAPATSLNNYKYQVLITGACPDPTVSNAAVLTVNANDVAAFTIADYCAGQNSPAPAGGYTAGGTFSFNVAVTDGATINSGTGIISNGVAGTTYTVKYVTSGTCPASATSTVKVIANDVATFAIADYCEGQDSPAPTGSFTAGGTFSFNVAPGDGATINAATGVISNGVAGTTYDVKYTTAGTCSETATAQVKVNANDVATFDIADYCFGQAAPAPTGGFTAGGTFSFNPAVTDGASINAATGIISNGVAGATYTVKYTTGGSCSATATDNVTVNPQDIATFTIGNYCAGQNSPAPTGSFTAGGTFSFNNAVADGATIDPNTGIISNAVAGTSYTVKYTTTGICPASATHTVAVTSTDITDFTIADYCSGNNSPAPVGAAGFTAGGTFSFDTAPGDGATINSSTGIISNGVAGKTYTIKYATTGACASSSTSTVTVNQQEQASFTIADYCVGQASPAPVLASGTTAGGVFSFNPAPADGATIDAATGIISAGVAGATYTVKYQTSGICAASATDNVSVDAQPAVGTVSPSNQTLCGGSSVNLSVSSFSGGNLLWEKSTNNGTSWSTVGSANPQSSGNIASTSQFRAVVSSTLGKCISATSSVVTITIANLVNGGTASTPAPVCKDSLVTVTLTGHTAGATIQWQDSTSGSVWKAVANGSAATYNSDSLKVTTFYRAKVTDASCGSSYSNTVKVTVKVPAPFMVADTNYCEGTELTLTAPANFTNYKWSTGTTSQSITVRSMGTYTVSATDPGTACPVKDYSIVGPCLDEKIPDIITPNGDGKNDRFVIRGLIPGSQVEIYNRWGTVVYNSGSSGYDNLWDGNNVTDGVYFYIYSPPGKDPKKGTVQVVH